MPGEIFWSLEKGLKAGKRTTWKVGKSDSFRVRLIVIGVTSAD